MSSGFPQTLQFSFADSINRLVDGLVLNYGDHLRSFSDQLLQLLVGLENLLRLMPWYLSQPFNASFWSFSFGVSALATTGLHLGQSSNTGLFHFIAIPLFIFTNAIIALLLVRTFILLMQGKLLIRTDKALLMQTEEKK